MRCRAVTSIVNRPASFLPAPASLWRAPLTVFLLSLLVSGLLAAYLARVIERNDRLSFEAEVARTVDAVRTRIDTVETLLRGSAGLFAASVAVQPEEFSAYVATLRLRERYPGVQGIGFSRRLRPGQEAGALAELRRRFGPGAALWGQAQPGASGERQAILMLEPMDRRNRAAIGFDMGSEAVRRAAMEAARDSGLIRASARVSLVQELDEHPQAGFLLYLPLYGSEGVPATVAQRREALLGFVYAPLRMGDLLHGASGSGLRRVDYTLYDARGGEPAAVLDDTRAVRTRSPRFTAERSFEVGGRTWRMVLGSRPEFELLSQRTLVPLFVLLALGASAAAGWITLALARERRAALLAAQMRQRNEAAVRASEERERARSGKLQRLADAAHRLAGAGDSEAVLQRLREEAAPLVDAPAAAVQPEDGPPPEGVLALPLAPGEGAPQLRLPPRPGSPYGAEDRLLLEQLAAIGGVALRNAQLLETLRDNDRRKDEFLAVLAHELRNPLAPLRTSLEILRRAPEGEAARRARQVAERQTAHMVRLIDDLLDVSRITHGTIVLQRRRVALHEVVAAAVETSRPAIDARAHRLRVEPVERSLQLDADPTRLTQVLANLLVNAASYTPPGGQIELFALPQGTEVEIHVRDNGEGIPPELLSRIFEPFMQAERSGGRSSGLGIGLMLVQRLVELHGGSVQARSAGPGRGSDFVLRLPLLEPPPATHAPRPHAEERRGAAGRLRILVVDDNRDAAESLATWLELEGHAVGLAHDGPQALEAARSALPEVVLLDIGMPGMDGYEVARRLRAAPGGEALQLVAITGWGQAEDRRRTQAAGFDLHLVKPIDPAALSALLRRMPRIG